jgi:hypothetical protein
MFEDDEYAYNIGVSRRVRANVNEAANPFPGEAYAIVRQGETEEGMSPYHAAAVIARDGNDTVTFETSAGTRDAKRRNGRASVFRQTIGGSASFHATMSGDYENSRTIVLRPRPAPRE